jgi:hypothetical protein
VALVTTAAWSAADTWRGLVGGMEAFISIAIIYEDNC